MIQGRPRDSPRFTRCCSKYFIEHFGGSKPPLKFSIEVLLTMCFRSCRWNDYQLTCSRIIFRTSLESSMPPLHSLNMAWTTIKGSQSPVLPCNGEYFQVFFSCTTHSALSVLFYQPLNFDQHPATPLLIWTWYFRSPLTAKSSCVQLSGIFFFFNLSPTPVYQSYPFQTQELSSRISTRPRRKSRARILKQEWTNSLKKNGV